MDQNLPITTEGRDLLTQLKWTSVFQETMSTQMVNAAKSINRWLRIELQSSHIIFETDSRKGGAIRWRGVLPVVGI